MGYPASVTNPEHRSTYENALAAASRPGFADGIGFVFVAGGGLCGIDLDDCFLSDAAEMAPWAAGVVERFSDTYCEISPSRRGVKIWCRAASPRCGRWEMDSGALEIYDRERFFTVTGQSTNNVYEIADHCADVEALVGCLDQGRRHESRVIPATIPKGQRHRTLLSLAGTMHRRRMLPEAITAALLVTNERQCAPPYPSDHIHKLIQSMEKWER
jgi:hypothetical protein